jgi:serine/threonine-protein kinase
VIGQTYAQRYRIDTLLGRGGMGEVYRVHDLTTGVDRALKILNARTPSIEDDDDGVERFRREIGMLSKIDHPGVLRIVDSGTHDNRLFFVSELIDGHNLENDPLPRPWPVSKASGLVASVADALTAAHAAGVVHRDVKPSNIMIATDGSVKLLDFGLARPSGVDATTLTRVGVIVGTPTYMSPEQFESRWLDARSDIYSLGVVLFELLTAKPPFVADTPLALAMLHKAEEPPSLRSLRSDLPGWIERVVLRCLQKDPDKRFARAEELARELRRVRESTPARRLPSGDVVIEDDAATGGWALELRSASEKTGWTPGTVLHFYDRYYKLAQVAAPEANDSGWLYRFGLLPQTEVIRKMVDYREDCVQRGRVKHTSVWSKLSARLFH